MKNLNELTLVKETEKAYCFEGFENTSFWVPKAWFKDGLLKESKEIDFKFNRRFALEKTRFELGEFFLQIEETEKAVKLAVIFTLYNDAMDEVSRTLWCPKSCLNNFDFLYKKVEDLKSTFKCQTNNPLDKLMNGVDWRSDEL